MVFVGTRSIPFNCKKGQKECFSEGKVVSFEHCDQENRPVLTCERKTNYDFSAPQLVQIFKNILVCVVFEGMKSHITVRTVFLQYQSRVDFFVSKRNFFRCNIRKNN